MKKYKIIKEGEFYRIIATIDFANIKCGEKGGLIEKESNLAHDGDAWVYGNAQVYDDAQVYGDARVCGNAQVYGNARVYGDARVCDDAQVCGDAQVSGNAWVYGDALVSGDARVYKSKHDKKVIVIHASRHNITIDGSHINIGCQTHTISAWLKSFKKIGELNKYSHDEIFEYGEILKMIKNVYFKKGLRSNKIAG